MGAVSWVIRASGRLCGTESSVMCGLGSVDQSTRRTCPRGKASGLVSERSEKLSTSFTHTLVEIVESPGAKSNVVGLSSF